MRVRFYFLLAIAASLTGCSNGPASVDGLGAVGGRAAEGGDSAASGSGGQDASAGGATSSVGGASPGGDDTGGAPSSSSGGTIASPGSGGQRPVTSGGSGGGELDPQPKAHWPLINGVQWADSDGHPIQAHGGGVLKVGAYYYWFGENRNPDGTFFAVSAYRSIDLKQWEFRNHVLHMTSHEELSSANIERPKVVYNESTGRFVMWMHWENGRDYGEARAAVASSTTVDGDYLFHGSFRPFSDQVTDHDKPGYMSRDCTLFVDDDGTGYFLSTTNENYDLNLYRLTEDYLEPAHLEATLFVGGHREAPALFKREGVYFLLTSGSTGWEPNQAKYATSQKLDSGWSELHDLGDATTYHSQSTFVIEVAGGGATDYLYMGDRWAGAYGGRVNDSSYVWQPLVFSSSTEVTMPFRSALAPEPSRGVVEGSARPFILRNKRSGLVLDVEGASSENMAGIVQAQASGEDSQSWLLDYNGRGYFRLVNDHSNLLIDVPDESTADGIELVQYDDHDGDNQSWLLIDLGGGEFSLRNEKSEKLMGVVGGSDTEGAAVEQRAETGGDEQVWELSVAEER